MAGLYAQHHLPLTGKNKLVERAATDSSYIPVISHALTTASHQVLTPAQAPTLTSVLTGRYTHEDLKKTTKLVLESFVRSQEYCQLQTNTAS